MRAWCSDGADLSVPLLATRTFPGLAFYEITISDQLLVTGKKPPSLAKFLTNSTAFCNKVGAQQVADDIAFVRNFGWAPPAFQQSGEALGTGEPALERHLQCARRGVPGERPRSAHSPPIFPGRARGRTVRACSWGRCWRTCARSTTP
eukprot:650401-Pyramimonas_sp.AAC.1